MSVLPIIDELMLELGAATMKHPEYPRDIIHAAAIVNEESGELTQAALDYVYEGKDLCRVRREAVQVGAMAIRFLLHLSLGTFHAPAETRADQVPETPPTA